ncbi:MAG: metal-sulfur cluster assembly factor [Nitrososphaerota archaeon]|jgi:metal-sulfur cluster biosynthetic enzyme|nr:metal-sulfur cluster assembly factor [Nitrososphaerota archaeon]
MFGGESLFSRKDIVGALSMCQDPELGANIVDIGLIQGISVSENNDVKVTLTMTSAMCPVTSIILADVQLRLEAMPGIGKVDIDLVWDPMWTPEMMSDTLKYSS